MPLSIYPLTRRQFLARSLTALAGVVLVPELLAAAKALDPDSWALLADTHIPADPQFMARGINMTDHFTTVSKELVSLKRRPAGVLIAGDCAFNSGEAGDYSALAGLAGPLSKSGLPLHWLLGNHDHRQRFWNAFAGQKAARLSVPDKHTAVVRSKRANWLLLDSLETTNSTPGLLGAEQIAWLTKALDDNKKKPAVVVLHHNPALEKAGALKDTAALLEAIRPRQQVKACVFGHTHVWEVTEDTSGIHLVNLPPVAYVFNTSMPSGWVHAHLRADGMDLELRCIRPAHAEHGQRTALKWR